MSFGNRRDKYFAVTDLAGFSRLDDGLDGLRHLIVRQHRFDFNLRHKIHGVFAAAINFGVAFLSSKALHFGHGHAVDAEFAQGVFDFFELERFDDGFNFLIFIHYRHIGHVVKDQFGALNVNIQAQFDQRASDSDQVNITTTAKAFANKMVMAWFFVCHVYRIPIFRNDAGIDFENRLPLLQECKEEPTHPVSNVQKS